MSNLAYNFDQYPETGKLVIVSEEKPEWVIASEAAAIMGVSVANVYYLCNKKRIRCQKWGNTWQVNRVDAENYERSKRNPTWLHDENETED